MISWFLFYSTARCWIFIRIFDSARFDLRTWQKKLLGRTRRKVSRVYNMVIIIMNSKTEFVIDCSFCFSRDNCKVNQPCYLSCYGKQIFCRFQTSYLDGMNTLWKKTTLFLESSAKIKWHASDKILKWKKFGSSAARSRSWTISCARDWSLSQPCRLASTTPIGWSPQNIM